MSQKAKFGFKHRFKFTSISKHPLNTLTTFMLLFSIASCQSTKLSYYADKENPRDRSSYIQEAKNGMITAAHPLASKAGQEMLLAGGNAVDAAVAASFMISVVRPQSTGIGGGGFLLYHEQKTDENLVYDFRERAPAKATTKMFLDKDGNPASFKYKNHEIPMASINGHKSAGIPGLVAGLIEIHESKGLLPLEKVLAPAIKIAESGFEVYPSLAFAIEKRASVMKKFEGTKKIFFPNGQALKAGEQLVQKDLAKTLTLIAKHGKDGFYKGLVAKNIVKEMKNGGLITQKDLDDYKVKMREPVQARYKGHKIVSMPPPSSGGVHIIQILNMLANDRLEDLEPQSVEKTHLLAEAMRRAYADRAKYLGDPDFVSVPTSGLTSFDYAQELRTSIDKDKASLSKDIHPGNPLPFESKSTTHISVVDRWGNGVSTTQTVNYIFGSCVTVRGSGFILNDEMDDFSIKPGSPNAYGLIGGKANSVAANKTMLSSMSPTLVFSPENKLKLVLGSPGGSRIITATLQTIINVIDHKLSLPDAVHSSRIHNQWYPDEIRIEKNNYPENFHLGLSKLGHTIKEHQGAIGDVQAIGKTNSGWIGVSDTRSDGLPLGY